MSHDAPPKAPNPPTQGLKPYLERLAECAGAPVKYVGIGPEREQTILL